MVKMYCINTNTTILRILQRSLAETNKTFGRYLYDNMELLVLEEVYTGTHHTPWCMMIPMGISIVIKDSSVQVFHFRHRRMSTVSL